MSKKQHKFKVYDNNTPVTVDETMSKRWKKAPPYEPMNAKQARYEHLIESTPFVIATGVAGTSKTYTPTRIAARRLINKAIKQIILIRPARSLSPSLGFFKGDHVEKMKLWLMPILDALNEDFPYSTLEYYLKPEVNVIRCVPMEVAKGISFKNAFIIIDEASDLELYEVKTLLTRLGTNCTMVFCGDIEQSALGEDNGISQILNLREQSWYLESTLSHIDFDDIDEDCVRSEACKNVLKGFREVGM